jgi:hypothetical protein
VSVNENGTRTPPKDEDLFASVDEYLKFRPENYQPACSQYITSGIYQAAAAQMATNAREHLFGDKGKNFSNKMTDYFHYVHGVGTTKARRMANAMRSPEYNGSDELVMHWHRKIYQVVDNFYDFGKDPHLAVPLIVEMLQGLERVVDQGTTRGKPKHPTRV